MKRKAYGFVLLAEAAACIALAFLQVRPGQVYWGAVSFPFEQVGAVLRRMSLSGAAGNAAAILIYTAIGLAPALYLLYRLFKKRGRWEDCLLGLLSVLLFWGLYLYINPALFFNLMPAAGMEEGGGLMVSSCIWAVIAGYAVLRALRSFGDREKEKGRARQLILLLRCAGVILVFELCFLGVGNGLENLAKLKGSNTGALESQLLVSELVIVLRILGDAAAAGLELWMLLCAERLLWALEADRFGEETERCAHRLYEACRVTVFVSVICCICFNLLQLLLSRLLLNADYTVQIPVGRIALTLAVMLAAGYLAEGRRLKEENDLFI